MSADAPLLEVDGLSRWYRAAGSTPWRPRHVHALTEVSFAVGRGETLAVVGESGCGKSTLGRAILGLEPLRAGEIRFDGRRVSGLRDRRLRGYRREVQMVWQNAASAVNRRKRIHTIIREPLDAHRVGTGAERDARVRELLELVGLAPAIQRRYPHELSGGQLQRVVIARALALRPRLLVCDEPTAALDVSVRAQVVNLLSDLKDSLELTVIYISHDLRTVRAIADRVVVMYLGRIVETAPASHLDTDGLRHPYSLSLFRSSPNPDPTQRDMRPPARGEIPSAVHPPPGCAYHPRCPLAHEVCRREVPALEPAGPLGAVACHAIGLDGEARWQAGDREATVAR